MGLVAPHNVASFQIRDQIRVSCIGRRILYHWATREALERCFLYQMATDSPAPQVKWGSNSITIHQGTSMWQELSHTSHSVLIRTLRECAQSCPTLFHLLTVACQAPLSMGFSRQEYWTGLPFPPPGDLPNPRIKPASPVPPALAGGFFTHWATWEAPYPHYPYFI